MKILAMWKLCWVHFLVLSCIRGKAYGDDTIFSINSVKTVNHVSDKFLSISVDPVVLLTGLNLSEISLQLAQHLNPSFIRLAGPSTKFVKYVDSDDPSLEQYSENFSNILVTPSIWFGVTEWFAQANLTPIFGINDLDRSHGQWNPKQTLPLLDISDKLNVSCYWQLGYDCSNKSEVQYREDLRIFRHILDAFPDKRDNWKLVGSDLSKCSKGNFLEGPRRILDDVESTVAGVVTEIEEDEINEFLEHGLFSNVLSSSVKPKTPLWISMPKDSGPISFSSALSWAKDISEAARIGYKVIFRQPRLYEIFTETPVYWVSLLHKMLMGTAVLEVKPSVFNPQMSAYAHCARKQNNFVRSGAVTVMVINNSTTNHTVFLRFSIPYLKSTEVQSYILTSSGPMSRDTYLNGEKLSLRSIDDLLPKLRRAKTLNYLSLNVPPESVSFFVLTTAQLPVCVHEKSELNLLMDEIREDQNIPFSEEVNVEMAPRVHNNGKPQSLKEIKNVMEREIRSDEQYYKNVNLKPFKRVNTYKSKPRTSTTEEPVSRDVVTSKEPIRSSLIERTKLASKQRKHQDYDTRIEDLRQMLRDKLKHPNIKEETILRQSDHDTRMDELKHMLQKKFRSQDVSEETPPKRQLELELTNTEIRQILAERAKAKAAKKNIVFTSQELDEIMDKVTDKFLKNSNTAIRIRPKIKRDTERNKKDINMKLLKLRSLGEKHRIGLEEKHKLLLSHWAKPHHKPLKTSPVMKKRDKRDINLDLLKLKAGPLAKNKESSITTRFRNNDEKEATLRLPGQTSNELEVQSFESDESKDRKNQFPDGEVYAEMLEPKKIETTTPIVAKKLKFGEHKTVPKIPNFWNTAPPTRQSSLARFDMKYSEVKTNINKPKPHIHGFKAEFGPHPRFYATVKSTTDRSLVPITVPSSPAIYLEESDESVEDFDNIPEQELYPCIHEYFGIEPRIMNPDNLDRELWEIHISPVDGSMENFTPRMNNRNFHRSEDKMAHKSSSADDLMDNFSIEADYGELDSKENLPLRLRRSICVANSGNDIEHQCSHYQIGKPYDPSNIKINKDLKNQQFKILKDRLANKKKIDLILKKLKEHENVNSVKHREARSAIELDNNYLKRKKYRSLTKDLKPWKPSDIMSYKKRSLRSKNMHVRSITDEDVDSRENHIDYIKPLLTVDMNDGDYQLVFPDDTVNNQSSVNSPKNHTAETIKMLSGPAVRIMENELEHLEQNHTENLHTNIQKISDGSVNKMWDSMMKTVKSFFHDLGCKIKNYINYLTQRPS